MKVRNIVKRFDTQLSKLLLIRFPSFGKFQIKRKKMILGFNLGDLNRVEDRVAIYFDMFSEAETPENIIFKRIQLRRYIPATFYSLMLLTYYSRFDVTLLLIDYNVKSRFPSVETLSRLGKHHRVIFVWMETFDLDNCLRRIRPCISPNSLHVVTDDPELRLLSNREFSKFRTQFIFFPAPFFPRSMFKRFSETERHVDVSFFGAVDDSIGHSERKSFLEALEQEIVVYGFQSGIKNKASRPNYFKMYSDLCSSKMVLNFSNHGGIGALTNRVTEAVASGAVLVSTSETVLSNFLTPDKHYLRIRNKEEMIHTVQGMRNDLQALEIMSEAAQEFYLSRFTAEHLLERLLRH